MLGLSFPLLRPPYYDRVRLYSSASSKRALIRRQVCLVRLPSSTTPIADHSSFSPSNSGPLSPRSRRRNLLLDATRASLSSGASPRSASPTSAAFHGHHLLLLVLVYCSTATLRDRQQHCTESGRTVCCVVICRTLRSGLAGSQRGVDCSA